MQPIVSACTLPVNVASIPADASNPISFLESIPELPLLDILEHLDGPSRSCIAGASRYCHDAVSRKRVMDLTPFRNMPSLVRLLPYFGIFLPTYGASNVQQCKAWGKIFGGTLSTLVDSLEATINESTILTDAEKKPFAKFSFQDIQSNPDSLKKLLEMSYDLSLISPFMREHNGIRFPEMMRSFSEKVEFVRGQLRGRSTAFIELDCFACSMTCFPKELCDLPALKKLNISGNPLLAIPESIASLTSLQTLFCMMTEITTLPIGIGALTSLQHLYLSGNALTSIPSSIGYLRSLTDLDLSNNKLSELPVTLRSLLALRRLNLSHN